MVRLLQAAVRRTRRGARLSLPLHPSRRDLQQPTGRARPQTASPSSTRTIGSTASARYKTMTLTPHEFIRRFLIHVLPSGFHRIRHFGLFAKTSGTDNLARARELLAVPTPQAAACRCRRRRSRGCHLNALSMLRRPHGHHRNLHSRLDAAASANRNRDQDRHLMSAATASPGRHGALTCRSSIGRVGARPNRAPALIPMPDPPYPRPLSLIKQSLVGAPAGIITRAPTPTPPAATLSANKSP